MTIPSGFNNGTCEAVATKLNQRVTDPAYIVPVFRRYQDMHDGTDHVYICTWPGSPEGNIAADIGSIALDSTNGAVYVKTTDTLMTGWILLSTGAAFPWSSEAAPFAALTDHGYFVTVAVAATLPAAPAIGDRVQIVDSAGGGVVITAGAGHTLQFGNITSSAAGTATSTALGDSVNLIFDGGTRWFATPSEQGIWNLA